MSKVKTLTNANGTHFGQALADIFCMAELYVHPSCQRRDLEDAFSLRLFVVFASLVFIDSCHRSNASNAENHTK